MSKTAAITSGIVGGAATKLARSVTRRAVHDETGAPRLPRAARDRRGIGMVLVWAAAAGVLLAVVDLLREQRRASAPP